MNYPRANNSLLNFYGGIEITSGCWNWTKSKDKWGYGKLAYNKKPWLAHRLAYHIAVRDLTPGMTIDHLCRNTSCINPKHLEEVTASENTKRGFSPSTIHRLKTHCVNGHEFSPENTARYIKPNGLSYRMCRICSRLATSRYELKRPKRVRSKSKQPKKASEL